MKLTVKFLVLVVSYIVFVILFCQYAIFYIVLMQCEWPELDPKKADLTITPNSNKEPVRAMLLADTHLLGPRRGHWFDKFRREWQMQTAFQTAIKLHKPDVVFFLGDLFDEGLSCGREQFEDYVARFHRLFKVPDDTQLYVVVGNHDIGFHYEASAYLHERFAAAFAAPSVRAITIRGNYFVLVNSMAMEGDGCHLCRKAEVQLNAISEKLKCARGIGRACDAEMKKQHYSRPILLQHFPLYRESDSHCREPDEAPEMEKSLKFRERWDCLSRESTDLLLDLISPRVVLNGHTHHGCHTVHGSKRDVHEYTLPSFSWRNKDNPSFALAVFTPNNYAVSKCHMPRETTVTLFYALATVGLFVWITVYTHRSSSKKIRIRIFKSH